MNNDDSKFKYLNALSPTLYSNNTIAAKYNSNQFVVVNTANYTGQLGILSTNIELDNNENEIVTQKKKSKSILPAIALAAADLGEAK